MLWCRLVIAAAALAVFQPWVIISKSFALAASLTWNSIALMVTFVIGIAVGSLAIPLMMVRACARLLVAGLTRCSAPQQGICNTIIPHSSKPGEVASSYYVCFTHLRTESVPRHAPELAQAAS